jgi:5-methylcytosine-specific restriction endonuclease McrA
VAKTEDEKREAMKAYQREYQRKYYYRNLEKNREAARLRQSAKRAADPEKASADYRAWYEANRERNCARARAWWANATEEQREKHRACKRRWAQANPEENRARVKAWTKANPEKVKARTVDYYQRNKEIFFAAALKRKALKRAAPGQLTPADIRDLKDFHGGICAYCQRPGATDIEHMTPLSRGGAHDPSNVTMACQACNGAKGTRTVLEFLLDKPELWADILP